MPSQPARHRFFASSHKTNDSGSYLPSIAFFSKDVLACVHVRKHACEQEHSLVSRFIGNYVDRHSASEYVLSPVYSIHR